MLIGDWHEMTPTVNFASRAATDYKAQWGPRLIPDYQMYYVASGHAALLLGSERFEAAAGDFLFYGPDCPHLLSAEAGTDYFSLHFSWNAGSPVPIHPAPRIRDYRVLDVSLPAAAYAISLPGYGEVSVPHRFTAHGQEPLLMRIVNEYRQERPGFPVMLRALLMELLGSIIRQLTDQSPQEAEKSRIAPALDAMREQPGRSWTVSELARLCGYNPSYFTDVFRRELGKNPKAYLIAERIRQTKQGLLRGEKPESLAEKLGYTSVHYLSHQFKKETGLTPGQFRQHGANADEP
ncbi:helix-turn-helix domain-containing protein [Paenibacillus ginsengarvi]|uniref:AraC family transcriptional regulator n=1 Tax=Paenibacillus ginsengarvi TaxID=400777 RepID=A0A3B0AXY4_9BACL|nr:AraC family transcriptional regulator [Paenibacillus ginsengarvi]RKN64886.1 AraC family transcriptional regulator [Paenibacillus ginsengarvi]